jgi:amino acid transporter
VLQGTALAFYALLGFEDSVNLAEETKDPARDFPYALFGGVMIAALIYIAVAFTATMLVDTQTLMHSSGPLLEVVKVAGLAFPPKLFALIALFAVANTALMNMIMASRLVYGMARQRVVPGFLARVHSFRGTPWVAILFTTAIAVVLVATGDIGGLPIPLCSCCCASLRWSTYPCWCCGGIRSAMSIFVRRHGCRFWGQWFA